MKTEECLDLLGASRSIPAPEGTPLHQSAVSVLSMVQAYGKDGRTFLRSGDPVNALASAWYGSGWLHFGISFGLIVPGLPPECPFQSPSETLPLFCSEKLSEKTRRYKRLLAMARDSVQCCSEPETAGYRFAERVSLVASVYANRGEQLLAREEYEIALACFSYGHGWIDAAVRCGLFRITANRDLFTV